MSIRTLFLDGGGVLVFPSWPRISQALARQGVAVAEEALARAEAPAKREMDRPAAFQAATDARRGWLYFDLVLKHAGVEPSDATDAAFAELRAYHAERNLWELVPPEVVPALERFRGLGLRLVVVSNANGRLRLLMDRLGLSRHFDLMLDSHEEGVEKPDPRLFRIALERAGAEAATTAHVGDFYHVDVVGARAAGLRAVLLDPGGLYPEADCLRVASLGELADALAGGRV